MASTWYRYIPGKGCVEIGGEEDVAPRVHVIEDTMTPQFNHADMRWYDSKSEFRKAAKACGCEVLGSELNSIRRHEPERIGREGWKRAIAETIDKLSR